MKLVIFSLLISQVIGQQSFRCGADGVITTSGSTTVFPFIQIAGARYKKGCPGSTVTYNGTGTSAGARSVCADESLLDKPTDIGYMSREFKLNEAVPVEGKSGFFDCAIPASATAGKRQVIRMPVAIDGLTVVTARVADSYEQCVSKIPYFDVKHIRWMYSNLTNLEEDMSVVEQNFDKDPTTKTWNELFAGCPQIKITAIGPSSTYGTSEYFRDIVFTGVGEGYRSDFIGFEDNSLALTNAVLNTNYSVGFMGFSYYNLNNASLAALPIEGVFPSHTTLEDGSYKTFARRIYSMYWNDEETLKRTKCYGIFTYSKSGIAHVEAAGFIPIPEPDVQPLFSLLPGPECNLPTVTNAPTPRPTRCCPPFRCTCFILFRILRLCCRQ